MTEEEQEKLAKLNNLLNYRISCRTGDGIEDMLKDLVKRYFPIKDKVEQTKGITINGKKKTEETHCCLKSKKKKDDINERKSTRRTTFGEL